MHPVRQAILTVRDVNNDMHEHAHTVQGIKDLVLAQNGDVHDLTPKKLIQHQNIDQDIFTEDVRTFGRYSFKQKTYCS